ncbi:MAG: hypothetical protein M1457_13180 [bacterium]|nr:hypothetical protein [bacterium]
MDRAIQSISDELRRATAGIRPAAAGGAADNRPPPNTRQYINASARVGQGNPAGGPTGERHWRERAINIAIDL